MIQLLPGEITDPNWTGARCNGCGRPLGEGFSSCSQYAQEGLPGKTHLSIESIKPDVRRRYFVNRAWSNAQQEAGGLLEAIEWMATPRGELNGQRPLDMLRADGGPAVLELQYSEWPRLGVIDSGLRSGLAAIG